VKGKSICENNGKIYNKFRNKRELTKEEKKLCILN
jgi:hypothetical protein